jgi:uncharacterized protein YbjT (DUF2867 family)
VRALVTGATGFVGAALIPRLHAAGHDVRAYARVPGRVVAPVPVVEGDAVAGTGLDAAMDGIDVAYYLIHSMEPGELGFTQRDRQAAENFAAAAQRAGVGRIVYLGGLVPERKKGDGALSCTPAPISPHLASRLEVERVLLEAVPAGVALRASIVIGARSRSFRFLVRLVERVPILPLPGWRDYRTQPIDARDVFAFLVAAATTPHAIGGLSLDIAGPEVLTYGEIVEHIRDHMLVGRVPVRFSLHATAVASRVAAAIAGEEHALIGPLMAGLEGDLLPRDDRAPALLHVRLHSFDAAVERALREWEEMEPLAAR